MSTHINSNLDVVDGGRHNQKVNVSNTCGCVIRSKPRLGNGKNPAKRYGLAMNLTQVLKVFTYAQ